MLSQAYKLTLNVSRQQRLICNVSAQAGSTYFMAQRGNKASQALLN